MSEIEEKVAQLEATEKEVQDKLTTLEQTKAEIKDYEERKAALELELKRVQADIEKAKEERRQLEQKDKSFQEKLREENLQAAKTKLFSQFEYKPEDQQKLLDIFQKFDSGAVNSDLIYEDLLKAHAALNAKKYLELEQEVSRLRSEAAMYKQESSSSAFTGGFRSSTQEVELNEDDIRAAQWAGIPVEKYKELKAKGLLD